MSKSKEIFMEIREKELAAEQRTEQLPAFYIDQQIKAKLKTVKK